MQGSDDPLEYLQLQSLPEQAVQDICNKTLAHTSDHQFFPAGNKYSQLVKDVETLYQEVS
jgi:hypothetical protein